MAAEGIIQYSKEIIDDLKITTNTTYSSDKIEKLLASIPNGNTTEVILGCFDNTNVPTTFVQDDQYYNTTDGKIYKATSSTVWDAGTAPKEDVLYASIADNKIYAYIKNVWGVYGGNTTKISAKTNNIVTDLQGQTNANEDGLYVPLSKKSGNVIDNLTGQATDVNNGLFVGKSAKTTNALQKLTGNTNPSEDGLYVEDLNPKINLINQTTKLNNEGTREHLYITGKTGTAGDVTPQFTISTAGEVLDVLYTLRNESINTDIDSARYDFTSNGVSSTPTGSYIILKAGVNYKIKSFVLVSGSSSAGRILILDENGDCISNRGYSSARTASDVPAVANVKYNKDTKIFIKFLADNVPANIYPGCSYVELEATNYLTIDPLQYIDTNNGTQDTPVGTVINVMGINAPKHYLPCDNSEYQVKDYPHLAEYFKKEFGSVNKFGGDGTNTFKTPDLRGEFLRGAGTATRNTGSGGKVGTHQDSTYIPTVIADQDRLEYISATTQNDGKGVPINQDKAINSAISREYRLSSTSSLWESYPTANQGMSSHYGIRPTNTSVLYCIKAEPTYFINVIGTTTETELLDTPVEADLPTGTNLTLMINNDVTLNDKITNYDKIQVKIGLIDGTDTSNRKTSIIEVNDISYANAIGPDTYSYDITAPAPTGLHIANLFYSFKDDETLTLIRTGYYCTGAKSWQKLKLLSVKGIKTTSVVQGGNFGSGNSDCDCGKLTDAQIATAVNETKTKWDT